MYADPEPPAEQLPQAAATKVQAAELVALAAVAACSVHHKTNMPNGLLHVQKCTATGLSLPIANGHLTKVPPSGIA